MADPTIVMAVGDEDLSIRQATWILTTADPTGIAVGWPEYGDRTWSVTASAVGAATLEIQGSNNNVEAQFVALSNAAGGTALSYTAVPKCAATIEAPRYCRPKLTAVGAGATWTITLIARRGSSLRT